jgi:hypothetical protein
MKAFGPIGGIPLTLSLSQCRRCRDKRRYRAPECGLIFRASPCRVSLKARTDPSTFQFRQCILQPGDQRRRQRVQLGPDHRAQPNLAD